MRIKNTASVLSIALVLVAGCAHYNRATVEPLARKNANATAVTAGMCSDFAQASKDLQEGPDSAWPLVGKKSDIEAMSVKTAQQGIACSEVVKRGGDNPARALPGLTSTWQDLLKILE